MSSADQDQPAALEVQPPAKTKRNHYIIFPYDGKILPGTAQGSKLYINATKSVKQDKCFALTIGKALITKSHIAQAALKFGGSTVVTIPLLYDASGKPLTMENFTRNPERINLRVTCFHAVVAFGKPDCTHLKFPYMNAVDIDLVNVEDGRERFQLWVTLLDMLAKYIHDHFNESAIKTMELKSPLFTWMNFDGSPSFDGATRMLKVVLD